MHNHHGVRDLSLDEFSKTLDKHREPGRGTRFILGLNYNPCPIEHVVSVLAISITTVALAEIGDKTQLLSLLLASRYQKPIPIIIAISLATLVNHALAAWLGVVVADHIPANFLKWVLFISFLVMACWIVIPDKLDEDSSMKNRGAFLTGGNRASSGVVPYRASYN